MAAAPNTSLPPVSGAATALDTLCASPGKFSASSACRSRLQAGHTSFSNSERGPFCRIRHPCAGCQKKRSKEIQEARS